MYIKKEDILNQMKYVDGITIIDTSGTILFTVKFNPRFHLEAKEMDKIVGKNVFEVFPNIDKKNSTLLRAMETSKPIFRSKQTIIDFKGREVKTMNITLPIKSNGRIVGAIELSKDITKADTTPKHITELSPEMFDNKILKKKIPLERAIYTFDDIITENDKMKEIKNKAKKLSMSNSPVFIYGETGTGKELFAHAIHNTSNRKDKPFIAQNCAAIPENLFESILFGTTKGSFTGANDNPGLFELANGGTIFLDEINSMPIHLQSKLLRVIQDGCVRRIGGRKTYKVDVRIIAAANKTPKQCLKYKELRTDVYYRICAITINIPPLRDRKDDIPILLNFFINKYNNLLAKNVKNVSKEVYRFFMEYSWPGNVRELEHIIEYGMNIVDSSEDTLQMIHIKEKIEELAETDDGLQPLKEAVAKLEKKLITKAIRKTQGNVSKAARLLRIPRQTLQNKLKYYGIDKN